MRIAISAQTSNGLDSVVAQHFGRCEFFAIVEVEGEEIKTTQLIENPFFAGHEVGQVPQFIHEQKVDLMISGGMGGRAIQYFEQFEIGVSTGAGGTVSETLKKYLAGDLNEAAPCSESIEHGHGDSHDHHHNHNG
jgi:predicted Fe-Mo cluster-binding NifX family protein